MRRLALLFLVIALLYVGPGLLPGRTFAPIDLPFDTAVWKDDPTERYRASNKLLADVVVQFVPWDTEIVRMLSEGEAPWVNRWAGDGGPLFANPQTALFSPFTWPRLLFGLYGWGVMALMKLLAAALCMYWLARELDVAPRQAMFSGIVFATAGYTIVWLLFPITQVFALLPGLAAAGLRLMKEPRLRNAALVIVFAALCTAGGHPETLFIGVIGIFAFLTWEAEKRRELGLTAIIPTAVGAALGFLLLAIQIVPFLAILANSHAGVLRPSIDHPFRIWGMASQILPGILGSPLRGELDLTAVPMAENFNLRAGGYIGALVLMMIVLAFRELPVSLRRGLVIGTIALAISWFPPGVWAIARHMPVLRVLTFEYFALLFVFFGSLAAGPALAIVAARPRRKIGIALVVAGLLALAGGLVPLIPAARGVLRDVAVSGIDSMRARGYLQQPPEVYAKRLDDYLSAAGATTARRLAMPGACWLVAGIALLGFSRRRAILLTAAASAELFAFGIGYNPAVKMNAVPAEPEVVRAIKQLDPHRQFLIAEHLEVFPANLATLYRVRDAISYDAMNVRPRVEQLLPAGFDPMMHSFNPILSPEQVQALAPLGIRFVLSRGDVAGATRVGGPPPPAAGVYEVPNALPQALPRNHRPAGFIAGLVVSLLALGAGIGWLRLYLIPPPSVR